MAVKKCSYCKTRMRKVIYGMPTEEDLAKDDGYTEYSGCITEVPMVDWKCFECGSLIFQGHQRNSE